MELETLNKEQAIAYFCGELDKGAAEVFEEACFADADFFAEAGWVEEDLLLDYGRDALEPALKARFRRGYPVTQVRREKMVFYAALVRHVDEANI